MKKAYRYPWMTYKLEFLPSALKEWGKLGHTVREQIKKKLAERLLSPKVQADALRDLPNHYKNQAQGLWISPRLSSRGRAYRCSGGIGWQTRA